jgi:hypothetical protein
MGRLPFIEWDGAGWEFFRKARAFAILREPATEGDTGNYLPLQTKHKLLLHSFCIHSAFILHSFCIHSAFILHSFCIHFLSKEGRQKVPFFMERGGAAKSDR